MKRITWFLYLLALALLVGCSESGGAVVFAPTPLPPDQSPLTYAHPSGVFSLDVPRRWAAHEQYTTELASVSFAPPGSDQPLISVSAVNLGDEVDTAAFATLIGRYQREIRPDLARYSETDRTPMGDGSWRISGYRSLPGGGSEAVNTFIQRSGPLLAVTDITLPADPATFAALEAAANSVTLTTPGSLEATRLETLAYARPGNLSVVHTSAWTAPDGVLYVAGEVANNGPDAQTRIPVEVVLTDANGAALAGASDYVMGHALLPGGYAPFSLRFGGGQPDLARRFTVRVGGDDWTPEAAPPVIGAGALEWTDSTSYQDDGSLVISGDVTNTGSQMARSVRVTVTLFDAAQNVIGASSAELSPPALAPGERTPYRFVFSESGGTAVNYLVSVQGLE